MRRFVRDSTPGGQPVNKRDRFAGFVHTTV